MPKRKSVGFLTPFIEKSKKLKDAETKLERYKEYYRTNPTSKNRRWYKYYLTRVKTLSQ